eukprot:scaffold7657_cov115-Skeletonema_dohrnii-CCMP3373.AAC.7
MASNPSPSGSTSRSSTLNDALSLDIQVLALLLQRNHHQQHRCIYYRRLSMVLLALRRASLDWLLIDEFERLSRQVCRQQQADDTESKSSRKRKLKEEQWTIQRDGEHDTIKIIDGDTNNSSSASDDDMHTIQLINTLQTIRNLTTKSLLELSSRIIHATSPILHELSRGYFVPFLTVALACLGRIHVLVLRLGRELVGTLSQHVPKLRECVDGGTRKKGKGGGLVQLEETLSTLVSVQTRIEGSEPSNEWNDLMKPFTEISHDEFTKKMNNFVRDRRWKDAAAAFGIKADELNEMQILSRQSSDVQGSNGDDGKSVNMNIDDMGELVYMQHEHNDEKNTTKGSGMDDNMARVLDKRRIEETSTSAKKKKRRRKKKKSTDDQVVSEDAVDNTMHIANEDAKAERKERADDIKNVAQESAKAASKQSDEDLDSSDEPLQNPNLSTKESAGGRSDEVVMLDVQESEIEPVAKKEKKSKKKKTKKKKSKNVIDDIFG